MLHYNAQEIKASFNSHNKAKMEINDTLDKIIISSAKDKMVKISGILIKNMITLVKDETYTIKVSGNHIGSVLIHPYELAFIYGGTSIPKDTRTYINATDEYEYTFTSLETIDVHIGILFSKTKNISQVEITKFSFIPNTLLSPSDVINIPKQINIEEHILDDYIINDVINNNDNKYNIIKLLSCCYDNNVVINVSCKIIGSIKTVINGDVIINIEHISDNEIMTLQNLTINGDIINKYATPCNIINCIITMNNNDIMYMHMHMHDYELINHSLVIDNSEIISKF